MSKNLAHFTYELCDPAYTPMPESRFLTPEKIQVLKVTPASSVWSLYSSQSSAVKFLESEELVPSGKKVEKSYSSSADLNALIFPCGSETPSFDVQPPIKKFDREILNCL